MFQSSGQDKRGSEAVKIYHIDRDYAKSLEQQKKELKARYPGFTYLYTDNGGTYNPKIHFMAEEIEYDSKN